MIRGGETGPQAVDTNAAHHMCRQGLGDETERFVYALLCEAVTALQSGRGGKIYDNYGQPLGAYMPRYVIREWVAGTMLVQVRHYSLENEAQSDPEAPRGPQRDDTRIVIGVIDPASHWLNYGKQIGFDPVCHVTINREMVRLTDYIAPPSGEIETAIPPGAITGILTAINAVDRPYVLPLLAHYTPHTLIPH